MTAHVVCKTCGEDVDSGLDVADWQTAAQIAVTCSEGHEHTYTGPDFFWPADD
ncbi:hypothetical protein [Euzebya sp.]|uniref:hypothetical protein n=1 Tax=Euzebya sp. TaxID=1971409 RepID=UPI0035150BBE